MIELATIKKKSVTDEVFEQLRARILDGGLPAGSALPAERSLCATLGVNRSAVREALKRLEQARLVSVRHGGGSRVLDYREAAGLELLPHLLVTAGGTIDTDAVRSLLEMRSAIAPDIARLAADRAGHELDAPLHRSVTAMRSAGGNLGELQDLAAGFWQQLVDGCGNLAYRLAYNSLRETYDRCRELLAEPMAEELRSATGYASIADAVGADRPDAAEAAARELVRRGEHGIAAALRELDREQRATR